jgi:hypothetical protein
MKSPKSPGHQAKLLRVLQSGRWRLGGQKEQSVDASGRGTNVTRQAVQQGKLREDLTIASTSSASACRCPRSSEHPPWSNLHFRVQRAERQAGEALAQRRCLLSSIPGRATFASCDVIERGHPEPG